MWNCNRITQGLLLVGLTVAGAAHTVAAEPIEFNRDIRSILADKCFACHGPDAAKREAELRLDVRDSATEDRGGYRVIDPAAPHNSEFVTRILSEEDDRMPPPEFGKPLTPGEIEQLQLWIEGGAVYQEHWSLVSLAKPTVPDVEHTDRIATPVDAFVLSKLEAVGIAPSPVADPRTLVRRLSFDLLGLPPDPHVVDAFVADPSPEAYAKLVEECLQSPHFGERLAIYWLDLVRYADTLGYHGDQVRSVSPYRDYVIRAFNEDKPFDDFTIEQIAGDLLPDATLWQKVASTYNRLNRASAEGGVQPKEYLAKYAADRVRTAGGVWLGSTFGCAECHDHKFDPFTMKDFYSFAAFFADVKEQGIVSGANHLEKLAVPTPEQQAELEHLTTGLTAAQRKYDELTAERRDAFAAWQDEQRAAAQSWTVITPRTAVSSGGAKLVIEEQGVIRAQGQNPDKDVYTIDALTNAQHVAGVRLELLPHDSLPAKGPGRAGNGNLVIHQIEVRINGTPVEWQAASATHSQTNHPAEHVINGHQNGWAILPEVGKVQQLVLTAKQPVEVPQANDSESATGEIQITIRQDHGSGHNIGRFRVYVLDATSDARETIAAEIPSAEIVKVLEQDPNELTEEQSQLLWNAFREASDLFAESRERVAGLSKRKTKLENAIVTTLATKATTPRTMRVLPRGNWMDDSGEIVEPAVPHFLPQPSQGDEKLTRLDLARWLVSSENPLVPRTFVNRLWMLYFGHGICRSVDDLGSQGEWPSHPELLDWLAAEFVDSGWDVKHMVRLIVLSETYRQTSQPTEELRELDPFNRLFARQSRWRLDAEMVRDNALAVSGLLADRVGGKSALPYQPAGYWGQLNFPKRTYQHDTGEDQYRRGLYTHWQRTFLHPSLLAFDAPPREECTARRERSNTPLQSLVLLNDPTYVEAARVFAERVVTSGGDTFHERLHWAYREVLARPPREDEIPILQGLYQRSLDTYATQPATAKELIAAGLAKSSEEFDSVQIAAWCAVARTILNLHETISRY